MANMSRELSIGRLSLLTPTDNNISKIGQLQECLLLNPAANSGAELDYFKRMGHLIGFATRSGQVLDIELHPLIWMRIVGMPIDYTWALKTTNKRASQQLDAISEQAKTCKTDEEF
jgi:hypothetical protein